MVPLVSQSKRSNAILPLSVKPLTEITMRYDDRVTSVELDEMTIYEMMMAEAEAEAAAAEADCIDSLPEYDDQEWLDKGNY